MPALERAPSSSCEWRQFIGPAVQLHSGCVNVGGAQCNGLTGPAVIRDFRMKINFYHGLQSVEARFCVDLATTMAIKMLAPLHTRCKKLAYPVSGKIGVCIPDVKSWHTL